MESLKILVLADRSSARGGADWHLLGILRDLVRRHRVLLLAGRADGSSRPPCPVRILPGLDSRRGAPVFLDPVLMEVRPHVVHLHNVVNPEVLEWAARVGGIVTVQDHRFFCPGRGKWTLGGEPCRFSFDRAACASCFTDAAYFEEIYELTSRRLEALKSLRVVVLSRYMAAELEQAGVDPSRVFVIPPFVHGLDPAAPPEGPPSILFVGRLVVHKGVLDAVHAWRMSGLGLPLVIAGSGPLRGRLEREPGVLVRGWVPHKRLSGLYRAARAVLMPSRWQEPFGLVGLEALSLGTPVVAWESGGIAEWHPGEGLVAWGDVAGLAEGLRAAVGRRARPPRGFEREEAMARLEAVYREQASACGGAGRTPRPARRRHRPPAGSESRCTPR